MYLSGGKGCSKYRSTKDPKCNDQEGCKWVKGQGCKSKSQKKEFRGVSRTPTTKKSTAKKSESVTGNDFIELALSRLDDNNGELEEKYRYWNDNNGNKFKIVRVVEFGSSRGDTYIEFYESENFTLGTEILGFSFKKFSGRDILYRSNKSKFSQEKPPKKGKKKSAKKKDGRLSAREYVEEYGGEEGDVCDVRNNGELKCLLFRENKNKSKSPYWSKLDAPKAREVMACRQGKSCRK